MSRDLDILKYRWFDKHSFPITCNDILCLRGCIDFDYLYSDHIEVCRQCQTLSWLQIVKLSLWFIKDPIHFYNGVFMKILYELECSVLSLVENVETTGIILFFTIWYLAQARELTLSTLVTQCLNVEPYLYCVRIFSKLFLFKIEILKNRIV